MKLLTTLVLAAAVCVTPAAAAAQSITSLAVDCAAGAAPAGGEAPNLHGNWDFLMVVGGAPNFGLLSFGFVGDAYGGSLSLWRTAPVVLRRVTVTGNSIHLAAATPDGDVLFDGRLSPQGDRMCGTVTYHGGRTFPAVAQKRPSTYQSRQGPQRNSTAG